MVNLVYRTGTAWNSPIIAVFDGRRTPKFAGGLGGLRKGDQRIELSVPAHMRDAGGDAGLDTWADRSTRLKMSIVCGLPSSRT